MNNNEYRVGVNRGLPVGMGYFSVSFGFGAMAVSQGLKTLDAVLISATNLTSAGQFAGLTLIVAAATLWELVLTQQQPLRPDESGAEPADGRKNRPAAPASDRVFQYG